MTVKNEDILNHVFQDDVQFLIMNYQSNTLKLDIEISGSTKNMPKYLHQGAPLVNVAAFCGALKCTHFLLSSGAKIPTNSSKPLLSECGAASGLFPMIQLLQSFNIDMTPGLFTAIELWKNDLFMWMETNINNNLFATSRFNKRTYIHYAVLSGNMQAFSYFVNTHKMDPNCIDSEGKTPFFIAVEMKKVDIVQSLFPYPTINVNKQDNSLNTPLHAAIKNNDIQMVKLLISNQNINLDSFNNNHQTPLLLALESKKMELAQEILNTKRIYPNYPNKTGQVALHIAAKNNYCDLIPLLLSYQNIDINRRDSSGV
ncbi:hypothetical protein TRFO_17933 [Tritrichomonas foetus]|uniref:Uncharacterized protein n=1 Tax=Tritrichomonas foetus TaxID=1144522 RepID=A0A1J4KRA5_9EUKA|nr:hypothetical protein TRFO_17933 [Tritrichomonas foetus]|eukprot:OHT12340.1 hypothetical protein TRFO_17933 [Tritrichomonas foetus]